MGLRIKSPRLQTRTVTPGQHALQSLEQLFQLAQQGPFDGVTSLRILRDGLHLLQRPFPVSLVQGLAETGWPAEVTVGQQFDLSHAQPLPGQRPDEPFEVVPADAVHAHKRPQRDHVRVDRKGAAKQKLLHGRADLLQQTAAETHPGLAARQPLGHVRGTHLVRRQQFDDELGLLEQAEGLGLGAAHQLARCPWPLRRLTRHTARTRCPVWWRSDNAESRPATRVRAADRPRPAALGSPARRSRPAGASAAGFRTRKL